MSDFKEKAKQHWEYNEGILLLIEDENKRLTKEVIELCKYFYIEAMKHGYKHGLKDGKQ